MSKNAAKIKELKDQLAQLEAEDADIAAMSPEQQLAVALHEKLCRWNHTDGCGWFYEFHKGVADWTGFAHGQYLAKARKVTHFCVKNGIQPKVVAELVDLIEE